jgi:hypothetical protein
MKFQEFQIWIRNLTNNDPKILESNLKLKRNQSEKDMSQLENRVYDQTLRCGRRESTILQSNQ